MTNNDQMGIQSVVTHENHVEAPQQGEALFQELKTATRHAVVYGMGNVLTKALGFVMLPFYTHYLTPGDYGVLEILDLSIALFGMFLTMGMTAAVLRCHAAAKSQSDKNAVISTALLFVAVTGIFTFSVGLLFYKPVSALIFGPKISPTYLLLSFSSFILAYISGVPRAYMRALEASGMFTIVDNVGLCLILGLNIYFVAFLKIGLLGILLSALIVGAIQVCWLSVWTMKRVGFLFSGGDLNRMLRFGWPLMFSNLALFTLNFSDRFFLKHFNSLAVVGVYAVGYKFGFMLNYLIVQPFYVMWQSRMYVVYAQPDCERVFETIFVLFSLGLTYTGLFLSIYSSELVKTMLPASFSASQNIIPIVVLAYIFWGIGFYLQLGMFLKNRTNLVGVLGAAAALLNLILNYALIAKYGMFGAAWATLLSFATLGIGNYLLSQHVFPVNFGVGRVNAALAIAVVLYLVGHGLQALSPVIVIAAKLVLLAVFPLIVWKLHILGAPEKAVVSTALARLRTRAQSLAGAVW